MAKDPAVLWYFDNWAGGTATFTRHLKGCYMDLLNAQFNAGRLSLEEIKTVLGSDFGSSWPALQKKFKTENGLFFNERLEQQVELRKTHKEKQAKNASKRDYAKTMPNGCQSTCQTDAKSVPLGNGNGIKYLEPKDYLKQNTEIQLLALNKNSGLSVEEFDLCLTQWSLKAIESGWDYSGNDETDLKRLRAGFEKWLNSWVQNKKTRKVSHEKPSKVDQNRAAFAEVQEYLKNQP